MTAYTIYPDGWFHRTPRAKMHGVALAEPPTRKGRRYPMQTSACGRVTAEVIPTVFRGEPNSITCAACCKALERS